MCTSVRFGGGVCAFEAATASGAPGADSGEVDVFISLLVDTTVSSMVEVDPIVVASLGTETVVELSTVGKEEDASSRARAGRTITTPSTANTKRAAPMLKKPTL
jgi:hypothetical protein